MGHAIGGVKVAYMNLPQEELRKLYMDSVEPHLTIEKSSRDEIAEKQGKALHLSKIAEQKINGLEQSVNALQNKITEQEGLISKIQKEFMKKLGEIDQLYLGQLQDQRTIKIISERIPNRNNP